MVAGRARPTMRCLRGDLVLPVPRVDTPLDEITHPLLAKASERFADDQTPQERISAIDDQVLFKVKIQRWRGAVWVDADLPWLVAAGQREEGSPEDFYAALAARGHSARAHYNAEHSPPLSSTTYSGYLLPGHEDDLRWQAEAAARTERRLRTTVHDLVRRSLLDGHEQAVMLDGAALGVQVLADQGHETYVAIRIIGSVPRRLVATILSLIPGCRTSSKPFTRSSTKRPLRWTEPDSSCRRISPAQNASPHSERQIARDDGLKNESRSAPRIRRSQPSNKLIAPDPLSRPLGQTLIRRTVANREFAWHRQPLHQVPGMRGANRRRVLSGAG
jgi:hypothetical protein